MNHIPAKPVKQGAQQRSPEYSQVCHVPPFWIPQRSCQRAVCVSCTGVVCQRSQASYPAQQQRCPHWSSADGFSGEHPRRLGKCLPKWCAHEPIVATKPICCEHIRTSGSGQDSFMTLKKQRILCMRVLRQPQLTCSAVPCSALPHPCSSWHDGQLLPRYAYLSGALSGLPIVNLMCCTVLCCALLCCAAFLLAAPGTMVSCCRDMHTCLVPCLV